MSSKDKMIRFLTAPPCTATRFSTAQQSCQKIEVFGVSFSKDFVCIWSFLYTLKGKQGKGAQDIHLVYIPPTYRQEKDAAIIAV
jgi:hypothetical protein